MQRNEPACWFSALQIQRGSGERFLLACTRLNQPNKSTTRKTRLPTPRNSTYLNNCVGCFSTLNLTDRTCSGDLIQLLQPHLAAGVLDVGVFERADCSGLLRGWHGGSCCACILGRTLDCEHRNGHTTYPSISANLPTSIHVFIVAGASWRHPRSANTH